LEHLQTIFTSLTLANGIAKHGDIYGRLTKKGLQDSKALGRNLRRQYGSMLQYQSKGEVQARGTVYSRTHHTAQGVLHGLYFSDDDGDARCPSGRECVGGEGHTFPTIYSLPPEECHLNVFDKTLYGMMMQVASHDDVVKSEKENAAWKEALKSHLPQLSTQDNFYLAASDYFTCRESHPAVLEHVDHTPVHHLSETVKGYTSWLFSRWYRNRDILSYTTKDMMKEFKNHFKKDVDGKGTPGEDTAPPKIILWVAHDTTLLSLLHAFKPQGAIQWPHYNDYISVEIFKGEDGKEHTARVLYNQQVIVDTKPLKDIDAH
jgi:hypothetical protein